MEHIRYHRNNRRGIHILCARGTEGLLLRTGGEKKNLCKVIEIVSYLVEVRRIRKMRRMRYDNRRVYADNSYSYKFVKFIKKKLIKELQPFYQKDCNKKTYVYLHNKATNFIAYINDITNMRCCQPVFANFFPKMRKNSIFFYKMGVGTKI